MGYELLPERTSPKQWPPVGNRVYYSDSHVCIIHGDCRDMSEVEDGSVDLVLTDPPYGLNTKMQGGTWGLKFKHGDMKDWDYLVEQSLIDSIIGRASKAIIWGANNYLMPPSRCWLIWDKLQKLDTLADFEMAWTNLDKPCKAWTERRNHAEYGNQHLTQKPLSLMKWCIIQGGDGINTILDPFLGSGTTAFAAKSLNRHCIGYEIEEKYCEIAANRCRQTVMELSC